MRCPNPKCGKDAVITYDTRTPKAGGVWSVRRRKRCDACGFRFQTTEIMDSEFDRLHDIEDGIRALRLLKDPE